VHKDQVTRLPENATVIASSEFCPYAAYSVGDQVLCFQGHPEFVHDFSRAVIELRKSLFSETLYQRSVDSLRHEQQGVTVAEWMMRFVAEGKQPG
jgi:GMP synthase-like glutamine amidotransferase